MSTILVLYHISKIILLEWKPQNLLQTGIINVFTQLTVSELWRVEIK